MDCHRVVSVETILPPDYSFSFYQYHSTGTTLPVYLFYLTELLVQQIVVTIRFSMGLTAVWLPDIP